MKKPCKHSNQVRIGSRWRCLDCAHTMPPKAPDPAAAPPRCPCGMAGCRASSAMDHRQVRDA
jgi:hypothetical protein